jgi:predicted phage tail protein
MTGGQRTAFIVTRDELVKLVGSPCQQYGVDYLIVDYKVLYCGDGKQPGQCTDYTSWQNGVYLRVDISPHTTESNPTEVGWFYAYGGYVTLEVNGYVYSIIPMHSLFGGDFMVINWNETLATAGISLLLAGIGFLLIRKGRRLRR